MTELWTAYLANPSIENRNALVMHYQPLVESIAARFVGGFPGVTKSEFVSVGNLGLLGAIAGYVPGAGKSFEAYAKSRILGSMQDECRRNDWVPKRARQHGRRMEAILERFRSQHGREPTPRELQRALRVRAKMLARMMDDCRIRVMREVREDDGSDPISRMPDGSDPVGAQLESLDEVQHALDGLTDLERYIVERHIIDGAELAEIAPEVNYTRGRVSQLWLKALEKIRKREVTRIMASIGPISETRCLSVPQVAAELGVSQRTIHRLIERKELPARQVGRRVLVRQADLLKYLNRGERKAS